MPDISPKEPLFVPSVSHPRPDGVEHPSELGLRNARSHTLPPLKQVDTSTGDQRQSSEDDAITIKSTLIPSSASSKMSLTVGSLMGPDDTRTPPLATGNKIDRKTQSVREFKGEAERNVTDLNSPHEGEQTVSKLNNSEQAKINIPKGFPTESASKNKISGRLPVMVLPDEQRVLSEQHRKEEMTRSYRKPNDEIKHLRSGYNDSIVFPDAAEELHFNTSDSRNYGEQLIQEKAKNLEEPVSVSVSGLFISKRQDGLAKSKESNYNGINSKTLCLSFDTSSCQDKKGSVQYVGETSPYSRTMDHNANLIKAIANAATESATGAADLSRLEPVNALAGMSSLASMTNLNGISSLSGESNSSENLISGNVSHVLKDDSTTIDNNDQMGGFRRRDENRIDFPQVIRRQNRPGQKFGAKKKLWVWSWFVQDSQDPNIAVCDYCGKVVRRRPSDKGSPKKLVEHLRTHKLTKTLANNTRAASLEGNLNCGGNSSILMPFQENNISRRKSSLSLLGLVPQQIHQVPINGQQPTQRAHSLGPEMQNYGTHQQPSTANYSQLGSDQDQRTVNDQALSGALNYTNVSPLLSNNYNGSVMHPNQSPPTMALQLIRQNHPNFQSIQIHSNHPMLQHIRGSQFVPSQNNLSSNIGPMSQNHSDVGNHNQKDQKHRNQNHQDKQSHQDHQNTNLNRDFSSHLVQTNPLNCRNHLGDPNNGDHLNSSHLDDGNCQAQINHQNTLKHVNSGYVNKNSIQTHPNFRSRQMLQHEVSLGGVPRYFHQNAQLNLTQNQKNVIRPTHLNEDRMLREFGPENENISPETREHSNKSFRDQYSELIGNTVERAPQRNLETDEVLERQLNEEVFDETPYSETKLLRHILAFLHENKLSINVIKLPSFRQLVFDLRPDSVKDLLVLDTVYSSCVEVARTSLNPRLGNDGVFSMTSTSKVNPESLRKE